MHFELYREANRVAAGQVRPSAIRAKIDKNPMSRRIWPLASRIALCASLLAFPMVNSAHATQAGGPTKSAANESKPVIKKQTLHHRAGHKAHRKPALLSTPVTPVATPPAPVPPAQQSASPAKIEFQQGQLQIDAQNSSLIQILTKISGETGLVVEGLDHDERIYGQYGPNSVAATLTALLDGAGYNYVIIGGGNQGSMKLLLTPRTAGGIGIASGPAAIGNPVAAPVSTTPAMANPSEPPHPKTPQEIFNELRRMHPQ
jgi:hypothetical protein